MKNNKKDGKRELAELLSLVLKHPDLPGRLYNRIGDAVIDMSTDIDFDSADVIELSLTAYLAKNKERRTK
jgi:hypothetical protein